jgi:hypothetical protein
VAFKPGCAEQYHHAAHRMGWHRWARLLASGALATWGAALGGQNQTLLRTRCGWIKSALFSREVWAGTIA